MRRRNRFLQNKMVKKLFVSLIKLTLPLYNRYLYILSTIYVPDICNNYFWHLTQTCYYGLYVWSQFSVISASNVHDLVIRFSLITLLIHVFTFRSLLKHHSSFDVLYKVVFILAFFLNSSLLSNYTEVLIV